MTKLIAAVCVLCGALAFAEDMNDANKKEMPPAHEMSANKDAAGSMDMAHMGPWTRKVTKPDKKGLDQAFAQLDEMHKKGDTEAMASMVDFPVMMVTDSAKGLVTEDMWPKEKWMQIMGESMKNMPKEMTASHKVKRTYEFLTPNIAFVKAENTMGMGAKKMSWPAMTMMIQKDGKWMIKEMVEGGWGDDGKQTMAPTQPTDSKTASK